MASTVYPCPHFQFQLKRQSNWPSACGPRVFESRISKSNLCARRARAARTSIKSQPVFCSITGHPVSGSSAKRSVLKRSIVTWRAESCSIRSRPSSEVSKRRKNKGRPRSGAKREGVPGAPSRGCSTRSIARLKRKAAELPCGPIITTAELGLIHRAKPALASRRDTKHAKKLLRISRNLGGLRGCEKLNSPILHPVILNIA